MTFKKMLYCLFLFRFQNILPSRNVSNFSKTMTKRLRFGSLCVTTDCDLEAVTYKYPWTTHFTFFDQLEVYFVGVKYKCWLGGLFLQALLSPTNLPIPPPPISHSDSFFLCPNNIPKPARKACMAALLEPYSR